MVDANAFDVKQSFPIASIVEAMQRRAQIEAQNQQEGTRSLLQGLQSFGQGVDSLVQRRQTMAQAARMGSAMGMTPDETQGLTPDQVVHVGTAKNKQLDLLQLMALQNPKVTSEPWYQAAVAGRAPAVASTPVSPTATPITPPPAPTLPPVTAGVAPSPQQPPSLTNSPLTPPTTGSFDVSQGTTTTRPVDLLPGLLGKPMNAATSAAALKMITANKPEPVMTRAQAEMAGSVTHGTHILPDASESGSKANNEQDRLENQVINRIVGIRGDKSLARTEEQRDAASQAYNTIAQIKTENRLPNQMEYYDILGQMWKARTGASPTDQSLKDLDAKTFKGDLGKAYQYFSGSPAPRTTEAVMDAIQSFADSSGKQADKLHSGYMQSHLIKPKNMSQSDFDDIVKHNRGLSFADATADSRKPTQSALSSEEQAFIANYEAKHGINK